MVLDNLLLDLSIDRAWQHMSWLVKHAPARISGSEDDRRAADYFVECLSSYGFEPQLDTFTAYRSFPIRGALKVLSPNPRDIRCETCAHIASTNDEGLEGELIFVGPGGLEDYKGKDARGKIVLTEISYAPPRPEKARIAASKGAAAIIFMNWGLVEHDTIPRGAIKSVWGNPTRATMAQIPKIPALGISRASGEQLRNQIAQGPMRVRVTAQATRDWGPLWQPWARLATGNEDFVLVGGHYDAWEPGVTDNASGNALMLELARVFAEHRNELKRDIVFVFWNGHEIGDMEGSSWYVDTYWDDLTTHCVAYINIDTIGMIEATRYTTAASPELRRFHQAVETRILGLPGQHKPLTRIGDQSFFGIGIPSIYGQYSHDPETVKKWHNATLGWWWHSSEDTIDKIDRDLYLQTMRVKSAYIWELCTRDVFPLSAVDLAEDLANRIRLAQEIAGDSFDLQLPIRAFQDSAAKLDTLIEKDLRNKPQHINQVNRMLMRLTRVFSPAFRTVGGRYSQDSYGLTALKAPIPALADLEPLVASERDSENYHLLNTELVRTRNRLADALRTATDEVNRVLNASDTQ